MKNEDLMTKVRSANPVHPTAFQDWTESPEGQEVAERILAAPPGETEPAVKKEKVHDGRRKIFTGTRLLAGATAALLILGIVGVVSIRQSDTGSAWAASLVRIAEDSPRLLLAEAGWEVVRADEFSGELGEMTFSNGEYEMDLRWTSAKYHRVAVEDRRKSAQESWNVTIAGRDAVLFQYEGVTDFTALWRDGDHSLELRGVFPTVGRYRAVAASLQAVDVNTWLSAMPESVVKPDIRAASVDEMFADIPVHPDVDVDKLKASERVTDRYQLGAKVTGAVACAWIDQWIDATSKNNDKRAQEAVDTMATSHNWAILLEMNEAGDYPEAIWEYAEALPENSPVSGGRPMTIEEAYESALGCEQFR
jgi:hypothetical protein